MYDSKKIPKIKIKETYKKDIDIIKTSENNYKLYRQGKQENALNIKTGQHHKELYSSYDLGYGKILMSGFGFGMLPLWLASKENVESIKIIEISQEVVDIFLENNSLPEKITIEIGDIEDYKTSDHYDCILLDHYENSPTPWKIRSMQNVKKNVTNHDLMWIWSIEDVYLDTCYSLRATKEDPNFVKIQPDFSDKWQYFKNEILKISTVPDLKNEKINEYIYTFIDFLNSKYTKK
jgi:hypothetical protein